MTDKKRILVVEDDRVVKSSLERLLQGADCCIESATTAQEGIDKHRREPFDFVLTDLKLPDMDGLDMIRTMRQTDELLPFIILSAYAEKDDAVRALRLGALDIFQKPFDARQILNSLRKGLGQKRETSTAGFSPSKEESTYHKTSAELADLVMKTKTNPASNGNLDEFTTQLLQLQGGLAPFVSMGRMTSGITHNINGFLTGLIGHLELMQMKHPALHADLDNVLNLAKKIRDNIGDLATKFDNETIREPQPQNLNQILKAELNFLRADLFFKHFIETQLDLQEPLPNVYGNYADFSLAFEEILLNAIDAQRDLKKGFMRVQTKAEKGSVFLVVEDKGPGFSASALSHAFDPLWPGIKVSEDGRISRGLGLYLAQTWLEPWGGTVTLVNLPAGGGQVTLTLPRREKVPT